MLWHRRLSLVGFKALEILGKVVTDGPTMTGKCDSKSCIRCEFVRKPFNPTTSHATEPLQLVHSDICGPLQTPIEGGRYMLLFIDDATRNIDEYVLQYKSEALEKFKE